MTDQNSTRPVSSFLPSPKFFNTLFSPKTLQDQESSPTSILDTDQNSVNNPFEITKTRIKSIKISEKLENPIENFDHEGIALALISNPNTISRKVLFASNLKIQIPDFSGDYGIKTRNSQFSSTPVTPDPTGFRSGRLSLKEMELSEEYTRVISHGPNPKSTHIYDNCVVVSCCGVIESTQLKKLDPEPQSKSFLSFCHTCNKNIEEGSDIFIYRGEKAFCSEECRCEEMVLDGLIVNYQYNYVK